jgi:threonine synthase
LRVPIAVGDFMILDAIRASGGTAVTADENRIVEWMQKSCSAEGISICPEAAACVGATAELAKTGWIKPDEKVVLFNCGAAQKYPHVLPLNLPHIRVGDALDWDFIASGGVRSGEIDENVIGVGKAG